VDLPGIEPATEIVVTCEYSESDDAKRRAITRNDLRIQRKVLIASTRHQRRFLFNDSAMVIARGPVERHNSFHGGDWL
jgi:hypothetical protein